MDRDAPSLGLRHFFLCAFVSPEMWSLQHRMRGGSFFLPPFYSIEGQIGSGSLALNPLRPSGAEIDCVSISPFSSSSRRTGCLRFFMVPRVLFFLRRGCAPRLEFKIAPPFFFFLLLVRITACPPLCCGPSPPLLCCRGWNFCDRRGGLASFFPFLFPCFRTRAAAISSDILTHHSKR